MATNRNLIPDEDLKVVGAPPTTAKPAQPVKQWTPDDIANAVNQNVNRVNQQYGNNPAARNNALAGLQTWAQKLGFTGTVDRGLGPFAPPPSLEKGEARLNKILASAPGFAGAPYGHDWDQWILSLPFDPQDVEYNATLAQQRYGALNRLKQSGVDVSQWERPQDQPKPGGKKASFKDTSPGRVAQRIGASSPDLEKGEQPGDERTAATINETRANTIVIVGPDGNPKTVVAPYRGHYLPQSNKVLAGTTDDTFYPGGSKGWLTDKPDEDDLDQWTARDATRSGELMYLGENFPKFETEGAFGKGTVTHPVYMTKEDFHTMMRQNPELVAATQAAHGIKPTGYITDAKTRTLMKSIADDASSYAQAGLRVDLSFFLQNGAAGGGDDNGSSGRSGGRRYGGGGGGYGGGGGGGGGIPLGTAKRYLNQYMLQFAGREANEAEVGAFAQAISGAMGSADFDAQQYTIDWVRMVAGKEVGPYQAATDYYQAAVSALGGLAGAA